MMIYVPFVVTKQDIDFENGLTSEYAKNEDVRWGSVHQYANTSAENPGNGHHTRTSLTRVEYYLHTTWTYTQAPNPCRCQIALVTYPRVSSKAWDRHVSYTNTTAKSKTVLSPSNCWFPSLRMFPFSIHHSRLLTCALQQEDQGKAVLCNQAQHHDAPRIRRWSDATCPARKTSFVLKMDCRLQGHKQEDLSSCDSMMQLSRYAKLKVQRLSWVQGVWATREEGLMMHLSLRRPRLKTQSLEERRANVRREPSMSIHAHPVHLKPNWLKSIQCP